MNGDTLDSYPWYISNWRGSTMRVRLSSAGRGMFRELLDYCWETGSLPNDERSLTAISGGTKAEFRREWPIMQSAFIEELGVLVHRKVQDRRHKLINFRESRRRNATGCSIEDENVEAKGEASACTNGASYLLPITNTEKPKQTLSAQQAAWFEVWWEAVWGKVGRGAAERAFRTKVKDQATFDAVLEATVKHTEKFMLREPQYRPHPSSWLNGKRWLDDISALDRSNGTPRNAMDLLIEKYEREDAEINDN